VKDLTRELREQLQLENHGVLVEEVSKGAAQDAGIIAGDVILLIDNKKIKNSKVLKDLVSSLTSGKAVPILVQRDGNPMFLAMKIP
jgi:serine protease Do